MKKIKMLTCILASIVLFSSLNMTSVSANDACSENSGNYAKINEKEYQEYLDSFSQEQLQEKAEKELTVQLMMSQADNISTYAVTKLSLPGTFNMYQQEEDTYCGPACIKSALMYIKGSSPTQKSINNSINESFTAIPNYMNDRQTKSTYLMLTSPTKTQITSTIKTDITIEEIPTFLRISGTSTANWYYATNGHCVLSNALYSDYSSVQIADPLGDRVSGCPYYYLKAASTLSNYVTHLIY